MKKVLLTTTALVMTAGVASAEITFSGSGEAGVYRLAPTAAVKAVAGRNTAALSVDAGDASDFNSAASATDGGATHVAAEENIIFENSHTTAATAKTAQSAATTDDIAYVGGVLTTVAAGGTLSTAAITADAIAAQELAVATAVEKVRTATRNLENAVNGNADNANERDLLVDRIAIAQAELALENARLANLKGSAGTGKGATPKLKAYSGYDFNIAASGASDNGMTFAMAFDMGAGEIADQDDDRAMDAQAGAIATSAMTIGYAGYTVEIGDDKIDDLYDDTQNGDVSIAGSLGDLTFKLVTDMDDDVKAVAAATKFTAASGTAGTTAYVNAKYEEVAAVTAVYNPTSYSLGYTMGNVAFSMAGTEHDDRGHAAAKMSLTYTMSDALSATLSSDNVGTYKDIAKVSVTSKISDALSITASVKDDKDHALNTNTGGKQSQDVSIAYTAGALSSTLATDEGSNWWVNAKYDLGGGASAFTTFDHTEFLVAGVNFKF